jgi:hypothetical protein
MLSLLQFDVILHRRMDSARPGQIENVENRAIRVLEVALQARSAPLAVTFEAARDALELAPRMLFEPDGSFVVSGQRDGRRWQVDGLLHDQGDRLFCVELHGQCPAEEFDLLLRAFGWPESEMMFQLRRAGVFVDEATFHQLSREEQE